MNEVYPDVRMGLDNWYDLVSEYLDSIIALSLNILSSPLRFRVTMWNVVTRGSQPVPDTKCTGRGSDNGIMFLSLCPYLCILTLMSSICVNHFCVRVSIGFS